MPSEGKDSADSKEDVCDFTEAVSNVREYFFRDPGLEDEIQRWCRERSHLIDLATAEGENSLSDTELFNEFSDLLTTRIEACVRRFGFSVEDFLRRLCLEAKDDSSDGASLLEALHCAVEYQSFMVLMRETQRGNTWSMESMFSR